MTLSKLLLMLPVIGLNVAANVVLKIGAGMPRSPLLAGVLSWHSFVGLCLFGGAGLIYALILRHIPLNLAQMLLSLQFVLTLLASYFLLHEALTSLQMVGALLIVAGILCIFL